MRGAGAVLRGEADGMAVGGLVDQVVHPALAIQGDIPGAVFRHRGEAHGLEQGVKFGRV